MHYEYSGDFFLIRNHRVRDIHHSEAENKAK